MDTKEIERCGLCNKKISLVKFTCKCQKSFCMKHRYPDDHNCEFDFKEEHKKKLETDNPKLESDKGLIRI